MIASFCEGFIEGFRSGPKLYFEPVSLLFRAFRKFTRSRRDLTATRRTAVMAERLASAVPRQSPNTEFFNIEDRKFSEFIMQSIAQADHFGADIRRWKLLRQRAEKIEASDEISSDRKSGLLIELILIQAQPLLDNPSFEDEDFQLIVRDDITAIEIAYKRNYFSETHADELADAGH